jgi:hypothetical protein
MVMMETARKRLGTKVTYLRLEFDANGVSPALVAIVMRKIISS